MPNHSLLFILFIIPLVVTAAPLIIGPMVIAYGIGWPADGGGGISLKFVVSMLWAPYAAIAALIGLVLQRLPTTHEVGKGILWGVCAGVILGISSYIEWTDFIKRIWP